MKCPAKHAKYDIPDDEFKCPKCGATPDNVKPFYICDPDPESHGDCPKLHSRDGIYCTNCEATYSGERLAGIIMKKKNLVKCPCCKGRGVVPGEKKS
jgi:DNA-directed RNA polymerase subunit RPC12/RpoP